MYQTQELSQLLDFGPTVAAEQQLKSQSSFEDEVESVYFSNILTQAEPAITSYPMQTTDLLAMKAEEGMELVSADPKDVTGQSLAVIKNEDDDISRLLEVNFDFSELLDQPEETDDVIQEMEEFLNMYEVPKAVQEPTGPTLAEELLSTEQQVSLDTMPIPNLNDNDMAQAEELLDMLLNGDTDQTQDQTDILQTAMESENLHDSGFLDDSTSVYSVSNVSQVQTTSGNNVIIVVQQQRTEPTEQDEASSAFEEDSDSDWTPSDLSVTKKKPGRKPESRTTLTETENGKITKRSYRNVRDRKQRKKLQNVEAARRYRDKKKQEQYEMEVEEQKLTAKNMSLKEKLADIQGEMKTMKKLMVELGLIKIVKKWKYS